jgi:hypothetical protein
MILSPKPIGPLTMLTVISLIAFVILLATLRILAFVGRDGMVHADIPGISALPKAVRRPRRSFAIEQNQIPRTRFGVDVHRHAHDASIWNLY